MSAIFGASGDGSVLLLLFAIALLIKPLSRAWMAVNHPETYRDQQQQEHERKMANKEIASKVAGPLGSLLGFFFRR